MARLTPIKFLRTTRADLDAQANAGNLLVGEPYLITDENRFALGLTTTTYETFATESEVAAAVQPGELATVATSGIYGDLLDRILLPDASQTIDPTLDLNFLTSPHSDVVTHTRASTTTYLDADGVMQTAAVDEWPLNHRYVDGVWVPAGRGVWSSDTYHLPLVALLSVNPGKHGIWMPTDLTSMRQGRAGATPVAAPGDPVGLVLDQSQWGGRTLDEVLAEQPELMVNGDFSQDLIGWRFDSFKSFQVPQSYAVIDGALKVTGGASNYGCFGQSIVSGIEANEWYCLEFDVLDTSGRSDIRVGGSYGEVDYFQSVAFANGGGYRQYFFRTLSNQVHISFIVSFGNGSAYLTVDNFRLRRIPGNHLLQPTASSRPTATDGLTFDGVDDSMTMEFPGGSGSSDMSVLMGVKTEAPTSFILVSESDGTAGRFMGIAHRTSTSTNLGVTNVIVDGVEFVSNAAVPRSQLFDAIADGASHVIEMPSANLSNWSGLLFARYLAAPDWDFAGSLSTIIVIDNTVLSPSDQALALSLAQQIIAQTNAGLT